VKKVIFLTNLTPTYRISFINSLVDDERIDLYVLHLISHIAGTSWKNQSDKLHCPSETLRGFEIPLGSSRFIFSVGVFSKVIRLKPDVIIVGSNVLSATASWAIVLIAKLRGVKLIRFEGLHELSIRFGGPIKRFLKFIYWIYYLFF